MKLLHLEYFAAVCRQGSTMQASATLSVSQPAVSAAIRELEKEFGVLLFERNGKRLEITPAGKQLYALAVELLERADNTVQIMTDLAKKRNRVRLGITPMLACIILPQLYSTFRKTYPDVLLSVTEAGRLELSQKLDDRELDMIISSPNPELDVNCRTMKLMTLGYSVCVHPNHPLAKQNVICITDLKDEPLGSFSLGFHHPQMVEQDFAEEGLKPNIIFRTSQISTMWEMVSNGLISCFMYTALQSQRPDLRFIPLKIGSEPTHISVHLYWRKQDYLYSDMEKLICCIKSLNLE